MTQSCCQAICHDASTGFSVPHVGSDMSGMKEKSASAQYILGEAKAAFKQAENHQRKISHAYHRLFRERMRTRGPETEAEQEAKRAYDAAGVVLRSAREHLQFAESTIPRPKAKRVRELDEDEGGDKETA